METFAKEIWGSSPWDLDLWIALRHGSSIKTVKTDQLAISKINRTRTQITSVISVPEHFKAAPLLLACIVFSSGAGGSDLDHDDQRRVPLLRQSGHGA